MARVGREGVPGEPDDAVRGINPCLPVKQRCPEAVALGDPRTGADRVQRDEQQLDLNAIQSGAGVVEDVRNTSDDNIPAPTKPGPPPPAQVEHPGRHTPEGRGRRW